jgi:lipid A 3-O-deacylase
MEIQKSHPGEGRTLTRIARLFAFVLMAGTMIAAAQTSDGPKSAAGPAAANPVAQVRNARSWEYGPFVNYGNGVGDRSQYRFLSAGFQLAKPLTPVLHAGILSGQFELAATSCPFGRPTLRLRTRRPISVSCGGNPVSCVLPVGGGAYRGVSLTPVIFRWNFLTQSRRVQPWFQGAGGLIYTTRQFPPSYSSAPGFPVDGSTSVWNFTPQGGVGLHYFTREKRSIDVGLNAVHISSASLGDRNPGVNASIQVQVGYTFWK